MKSVRFVAPSATGLDKRKITNARDPVGQRPILQESNKLFQQQCSVSAHLRLRPKKKMKPSAIVAISFEGFCPSIRQCSDSTLACPP